MLHLNPREDALAWGNIKLQWVRTVVTKFLEEFPITFFQELVDIIKF